MKNILIITTSCDDKGANTAFIPDINDVEDEQLRNAIVAASTLKNYETKHIVKEQYKYLYCGEGAIYSRGFGYVFNQSTKFSAFGKLPITVEHIIDYCVE